MGGPSGQRLDKRLNPIHAVRQSCLERLAASFFENLHQVCDRTMLSTDREATQFRAIEPDSAHFFVVRGRRAVLRMQPLLADLSQLCCQRGAADYLEYFLTSTKSLNKIPYLVLVASRSDLAATDLCADDLKGAALIYEYKVMGMPSGLFSTRDFSGLRGLIAPPATRTKISAMVCRYLAEHRARVVHVTFSGDSEAFSQKCFDEITDGPDSQKQWWTAQSREVGASIALDKTMDATLARIGRHTRRNLRYYRRKAELELKCHFESDIGAMLTMAQFGELNHLSTHPVPESILDRRFEAMNSQEGFFCGGVKTKDGQWISLLGGRRHHGVTEIDWQMNRSGLEKYSVGTVIRSYLIENEIRIGTERLFFEGGTVHTIRHSFLSQKAVDIIVRKQCLFVYLLRKFAFLLRLEKNFLLHTLIDPGLKWHFR
jgi:hypothetical protein